MAMTRRSVLRLFLGLGGTILGARMVRAFWLRQPLPRPLRNPEIQVFKSRRLLELRAEGGVVRTYRIGLGTSPSGPKRRQGDRRTPEGTYFICNKNPRSQFYLSLQVSYPNEDDAALGLAGGLITTADHERIVSASRRRGIPPAGTRLGGEIFLHGRGSGSDWTWGCVALDDPDIKELYDAVPVGTPVRIFP
jgi:murein L,D-transpeptidase YafK